MPTLLLCLISKPIDSLVVDKEITFASTIVDSTKCLNENRLYAIYELLGGIVAFAFIMFADLVYISKRINKKRLCIKEQS